MNGEFCITDHKGFRMTFENGYAVSVQWGPGNYTDAHFKTQNWFEADWDAPKKARFWKSPNAEIAVIAPDDRWATRPVWMALFGEDLHDDVTSCTTPEQVALVLNFVAGLHGEPSELPQMKPLYDWADEAEEANV